MLKNVLGWFSGLDTTAKAIMVLFAIGLLVIIGMTAFHVVDTLTETATETGVQTERAETQGKVIQNAATANEAAARYRADPAQRDADCLRDATNPENC